VTGATGFVGLNIVERLLADGHHVTGVGRVEAPEAAHDRFRALPGVVEHRIGDVTDEAFLKDVIHVARPDRLIVGAALTPGPGSEARSICALAAVNVLGALRTLEIGLSVGARRAVLLSSGAVYGAAQTVEGWLDEAGSAPQPTAAYAISKLAAEQLALRMAASTPADIRVLRVGTAFGPWERETGDRDTMSPIFQVMTQALAGATVILPREGLRDFVYVRDIADAVVALADAGDARGPYNAAPGMQWSVADWCRLLASRMPFDWRLAAHGDTPTVDLHMTIDRAPLSARRLEADTGFRAAYGLQEAMTDYLAWLGVDQRR
jgi:nucleoside-diphosphate-sugar epimerase